MTAAVRRVSRLFHATYHPSALCTEPGCTTWPVGKDTLAQVKDHVRSTGHEVHVFATTKSVYGPL
jgi:hypothetical protein